MLSLGYWLFFLFACRDEEAKETEDDSDSPDLQVVDDVLDEDLFDEDNYQRAVDCWSLVTIREGEELGAVTSVIVGEYNDEFLITRQEYDENADGDAEKIYDWERDLYGNITEIYGDNDGDGNPDTYISQTFDNLSYLTQRSIDEDGDGDFDIIEDNFQYMDGMLLSFDIIEDDILIAVSMLYDEANRLLQEVYTEDDETVLLISYIWSENYVLQVYDEDGDGVAESTTEQEFDDFGQVIYLSQDENGDGVIEYMHEYFYSDDGQLLSMHGTTYNWLGELDYIVAVFYLYDELGRSTIAEAYYDVAFEDIPDGNIDYYSVREWEWNCP